MEFVDIKPDDAQVVSIKLKLRAEITKEKTGMYSSRCPVLDVFSQGDTHQTAKSNLKEAIQLMIEVHLEDGTFDKWIKKQGFHTFSEKSPVRANSRKKLKKPTPPNTRIVNIPTEFPLAAYC